MSATFEHAIATDSRTERSERAFRVVRVVLGLLLLTAAGLKLYGMNVTALPRAGWFATPRVQIMAAEWELVLCLWLHSGVFQFGAWLAAIGTFATFAGVSGYFGWIGVANCGCFGVIHTSPWVAFAVDVAALVTLFATRPHFPRLKKSAVGFIPVSVLALLLFAAVAGSLLYGSPRAAVARLRGAKSISDRDFVHLGSGKPGESLQGSVTIINLSEDSVTLIGGTSDCSCAIESYLPLAIPPGESRAIRVQLRVPNLRPGAFSRGVRFWAGGPGVAPIPVQLGCQILESNDS